MDIPLPIDKLSSEFTNGDASQKTSTMVKAYVVLVLTGSFNPPTYMHLRMFAPLKVMLVCGSDLLKSFGVPGAWIREQVRTVCKDYGVVCIRRDGEYVEKIICDDEILNENRANIKVVDACISDPISSTIVREYISRGLSVKKLIADEVNDYIRQEHLYLDSR